MSRLTDSRTDLVKTCALSDDVVIVNGVTCLCRGAGLMNGISQRQSEVTGMNHCPVTDRQHTAADLQTSVRPPCWPADTHTVDAATSVTGLGN